LHPLQQGWTLGNHMLDTQSRAASQAGQSWGTSRQRNSKKRLDTGRRPTTKKETAREGEPICLDGWKDGYTFWVSW